MLKQSPTVVLGWSVRACDTVSRLGGDEFVVLAPDLMSEDEVRIVAQRIVDSLATPFSIDGRELHITPSIGICSFPKDGADVATLLRNADAAMYHAKANGRNNYQFFTQQMNEAAARHFAIESNLRGALARNEFELFYQPILHAASRRICSMEVLLRWRGRDGVLVMPDSFISIIEENGMIVSIGAWVMRQACVQSMAWLRQGLPVVPLAVNLSPSQFQHPGLLGSIRQVLDETGIDPGLLEFEITETGLMQHGSQTQEVLALIDQIGIRLAIDDFGTGYSSLAYLKRFPVKKIKIDRAFVKDLEHNADDRAIVSAIVALSKSLGLPVVVEGVETEAQFDFVVDSGCEYVQGYLFSRPVPVDIAEGFLRDLQ